MQDSSPGSTSSSQKFAYSAIALAVALMIFHHFIVPLDVSDMSWTPAQANTLTKDPCADKPHCLVVSIAPWCSVCQSALPVIRLLRDGSIGSKTYGMKIVITADATSALQSEATQIGDNTYVDSSNQWVRLSGLNAFPSWASLDKNNHVQDHFAGVALGDLDETRYAILHKLRIL